MGQIGYLLSSEELPHLTAMLAETVVGQAYDFSNEFLPGLDMILDGLEERHRQWRSASDSNQRINDARSSCRPLSKVPWTNHCRQRSGHSLPTRSLGRTGHQPQADLHRAVELPNPHHSVLRGGPTAHVSASSSPTRRNTHDVLPGPWTSDR